MSRQASDFVKLPISTKLSHSSYQSLSILREIDRLVCCRRCGAAAVPIVVENRPFWLESMEEDVQGGNYLTVKHSQAKVDGIQVPNIS